MSDHRKGRQLSSRNASAESSPVCGNSEAESVRLHRAGREGGTDGDLPRRERERWAIWVLRRLPRSTSSKLLRSLRP